MAEMKTKVNDASVEDFLNRIGNAKRREDAFAILKMMKSVTRKQPRMWGPTIVGFDQYHYKYESGREGDMCMIGFSPRRQAMTLYVLPEFLHDATVMKGLGTYTTGVSCLYIKKLEDVDRKALRQLITESYKYMKAKYA